MHTGERTTDKIDLMFPFGIVFAATPQARERPRQNYTPLAGAFYFVA
jgi:hypothetical protein